LTVFVDDLLPVDTRPSHKPPRADHADDAGIHDLPGKIGFSEKRLGVLGWD
jgi:hypothetical protein